MTLSVRPALSLMSRTNCGFYLLLLSFLSHNAYPYLIPHPTSYSKYLTLLSASLPELYCNKILLKNKYYLQ